MLIEFDEFNQVLKGKKNKAAVGIEASAIFSLSLFSLSYAGGMLKAEVRLIGC